MTFKAFFQKTVPLLCISFLFMTDLTYAGYAEESSDEGSYDEASYEDPKYESVYFDDTPSLPLRRGYCYEDYFYKTPRCRFSQFGFLRAGYTYGEGIGIRHSYSTLAALFAPLMAQDDYYPFLDLKGHYIKDYLWAGNAGVGLRWRDCLSGYIFGSSLYYDYRKTHISDFNQFGFGLEFFTENFEMRFNGYFPFGKTCTTKFHLFDDYVGNYFVTCHQVEVAQKGVDFEIGHLFWRCQNFFVYGGLGGYFFTDCDNCHVNGEHLQHHHHKRRRWGEKAKLSFGWGSFLSLECRYFHDQLQDSFWQTALTFSIPLDFCFGPSFWENNERVFTQPVQRNDMIVKRKPHYWDYNF